MTDRIMDIIKQSKLSKLILSNLNILSRLSEIDTALESKASNTQLETITQGMLLKATTTDFANILRAYPINKSKYDNAEVQLTDGYTINNWSGTAGQFAADTVNTFDGHNTVKIYHTQGAGILNPLIKKTIDPAVDLSSCEYIDFDVYIPDNVSSLQIRFHNTIDNTTNSYVMSFGRNILDIPNIGTLTGWQTIRVAMSTASATGSPNWNSIVQVTINAIFASDVTSYLTLANVRGVDITKALVSIDFDDGVASIYNTALAIMDANNLVGTCYINTSNVGKNGYMTWSQLHKLRDKGWSIACHSHEHTDLTTLTAAQIASQLDTCQQILRDHGFVTGSYFLATPFGSYNATIDGVVKTRFIAARYLTALAYNFFPLRHNRYMHYNAIQNTTPVATITGWIDAAITEKRWAIPLFHNILETASSSTDYATADFTTVCQYIAGRVTAGTVINITAQDAILQGNGITLDGIANNIQALMKALTD